MKRRKNLYPSYVRQNFISGLFLAVLFFLLTSFQPVFAFEKHNAYQKGPYASLTGLDEHLPIENRVTDVGNIWINFTNYGMWGNEWMSSQSAFTNPCTGEWAAQAEYPGGSSVQYLWHADLWVGALIEEEALVTPRVSVGADGWHSYAPEFSASSGIEELSTRHNAYNCLGDPVSSEDAISEQDFNTSFADTCTTSIVGNPIEDPTDGIHVPLGIEVHQSAHLWSYEVSENIVIIDYTITNIGENNLKNVYLGLLVDNDIGLATNINNFRDDTGDFLKEGLLDIASEPELIPMRFDAVWSADGDGRAVDDGSGSNFTCPGVFAVMPLNFENPQLNISYNWWVSNANADLDFGPSWLDDESPGNWTAANGTPDGDERKYFLMQNREIDYGFYRADDEDWINSNPQELVDANGSPESHQWRTTAIPNNSDDIANGWDTKFLVSFGPIGVFDYIEPGGNRVYRLLPGESVTVSLAFVVANHFHDANNPQPSDDLIDPDRYDFTALSQSLYWARSVYDHPMYDTDNDAGTLADGWYGEDTGIDGLYAENVGDVIEFVDMNGNLVSEVYPGPDFGERDFTLQPEEDSNTIRPLAAAHTFLNGKLDFGDSHADYSGPQPPPPPNLTHYIEGNNVILEWTQDEDNIDSFLGLPDFEGFRIFVSESGLENEYSFLAEFDYINYTYFDSEGRLAGYPYYTTNPDTLEQVLIINDETLYLQPVGANIGMDEIEYNDGVYRYTIENVPANTNFVAVTAYDFGNPIYRLEPMSTARTDAYIEVGVNSVEDKEDALPIAWSIDSVYPNPFNPSTRVKIGLPLSADLKVNIFNILGQNITTLANGKFNAGYHTFTFNGQNLASGIYYVHAYVPGELNQVKKIMLLK